MNKVKKFKDLNINEGYFSDVEKDKIKDIFIKYGVKYDNAQKLIDMILSETPDNHENIDTGYYYYVSQNNNRIVGHTNEFLFYTSFYTKNEIRKIKLNKLINEESKS